MLVYVLFGDINVQLNRAVIIILHLSTNRDIGTVFEIFINIVSPSR